MAPDSGDDDAAALRERVDELEQTVDDQQTTIDSLQEPTPSRRGVLAALTGVAGAGALGAYSQRGAAQAAGQVGTQSAPVDVEAWSLNVQDALAGDLDAGGNNLTNVGAVEANSGTVTSLDGTDLQYETVNADEVSHNIAHEPDGYIYRNASNEAVGVRKDGTTISKESGARLLPVLASVVSDVGADSHIYISGFQGSGAGYSVLAGDEITLSTGTITIEFSPAANVSVDEAITSTTGPDNRSYLIDFRAAGAQIRQQHIVGHNVVINCNGNVDVPFYFADHSESRIEGFQISEPSVGGCRWNSEELGGAQMNAVVDLRLTQAAGAAYAAKAHNVGDMRYYDIRANKTTNAVVHNGGAKMYAECVSAYDNSGNSHTDGAILVKSDDTPVFGAVNTAYVESTSNSYILRLDGTGDSIDRFASRNVFPVNQNQGINIIELAENGGVIGQTHHWPLAGHVDQTSADTTVSVTAGDPFVTYLHGSAVHPNGYIADAINTGPNDSNVYLNGFAQEATGGTEPTRNANVGNIIEDTDNPGTLYYNVGASTWRTL